MIGSWIDALGWALLHCLWQISFLALCYRAAKPLLQERPRIGYGFGLALLALSPIVVGSTLILQHSATSASTEIAALATSVRPASTQTEVANRLAASELPATASEPTSPAADGLAAVLEKYLNLTVLLWGSPGHHPFRSGLRLLHTAPQDLQPGGLAAHPRLSGAGQTPTGSVSKRCYSRVEAGRFPYRDRLAETNDHPAAQSRQGPSGRSDHADRSSRVGPR